MTRVEKHQQYRNSLIQEGTAVIKEKNDRYISSKIGTTTTLPIDQVIESINDHDDQLFLSKKKLKKKYQTITIIICSAVILIAIIAIIAVVLWRK